MRNLFIMGIGTLMLAGCAQTPMTYGDPAAELNVAIQTAEKKLAMAQEANAEWRIIDKATGGSAVDLSKILSVAKEKAEAGEMDEARRLADAVIKYSELGLKQSAEQAGSGPVYNPDA